MHLSLLVHLHSHEHPCLASTQSLCTRPPLPHTNPHPDPQVAYTGLRLKDEEDLQWAVLFFNDTKTFWLFPADKLAYCDQPHPGMWAGGWLGVGWGLLGAGWGLLGAGCLTWGRSPVQAE